jgi:hypothetical protein
VRRLFARFPAAFVLGAATVFFLDPRDGRRRRHQLRDRTLRALRRLGRAVARRTRFYGGRVRGVAHEARTAVSPSEVESDDVVVRQRILSDALRDAAVEAKDLEVDVHDGVATLRGTVPSSSLADDLVSRVREVPGVRAVTPALTVGSPGEHLDQGI